MKTILLPFFDDAVSQQAFELSLRILHPQSGYIEGLFVRRLPPIADADIGGLESHIELFDEECKRLALQARTRFEASAAANGLSLTASSPNARSGAWREIVGMDGQVIGSHGRLFDIIAMGRGLGKNWMNWQDMVESALFESGRPVLLVPEQIGATSGENVVIAWNSSTETARTIAFAKPLLARARAVTVMSVKGWGVPGPDGAQLAEYLVRAGIAATARTVDPAGRTPGATILDECTRSGADLLIKGAYTQSRLRQIIFGGATRHILAHANIPVIFAN